MNTIITPVRSMRIASTIGWVVLTIGLLVLLGWALDITAFKSVLPGLPPMMPNTAIAFALAGGALGLLCGEPARQWTRRTAQAAGCIVTLIGALTLGEYLFNRDLGLDQLFFRNSVVAFAPTLAGRPSLLSAINFLLLGAAVLLLDLKPRRARWAVDLLIAIPIQISLLALIGYACNVPSFYGWRSPFPSKGMSLPAALNFTVLGMGLLRARPDRSLMRVITSASAGGVVARRLLLAPVMIPLLMALMLIACRRAGFFNAEFSGWLLSFLNIFAFTLAIWWVAALLCQANGVREQAEARLREAHGQLEARVRERTEELQLILDTVPALIFFKDRDHRLLRVNLALAQTLGRTRESVEGKTDTELGAVTVNAEHYYRDDIEVMASGQAKLGIIEQLDTPGEPRWIQTDKLPYRNSTGEIAGIIGFAVDITERKRAEERDAWLASFPERNPNPIIEVNAVTGLIHYLNPAAARQFPDLQSQGMRHPLLAGLPAMAEGSLPATENTVRCELRVGESYFAQAATFLPESQSYRVYCTDITDRKRMEDALVRESQLLRTVIDHLPDYIYVKDPDARFLLMNAAGLGLMMLDGVEQVLGKTVLDFFPADQANAFLEDDRRVLETGQSVLDREEPITGHNGETRFLSTTKVPLRDASGQVVGLVGISRDITERSRAELASNRLAAIVESSDDAIIGKDLDGIVTSWNRGAEIVFGFSRREMVGSSIMRLIPADRQDEETHIMGKIRRGENVEHFETVRQTRLGHLINVSITVSPIKDASGKVLGVSKVARDITGRKRAETALRASEERYHTLFDYAPDGIVIADQQSNYLDANPSMCRMLGYTRDEFIGMHASDIVAQAEVQHIGTSLRVLKARSDYQRVWQFRRKDGSEFPAEVIGTMMPDGNLLGMIRDITERKNAALALREKEMLLHAADRRLAEILHGMTEACFALDAEWRFTFVNDQGVTLLRHQREEMVGRTIWETFSKLVGTPMEAHYRRAMTERVPVSFEAFSPIAERWLDIRLFPTGEGLAAFLLDIHARKQAEEQIRRFNSELEQRVVERTAQLEAANKELEAFSYSVSHDLRAPLRAVDGFSKAVLEDYSPLLPEAGHRYLKTIRDGAQRMGQLIDDLLTFSQTSRQALSRQEVHMDRLVRDALSELSHQQEGREVKITVGDLPTGHGDRALLKQVWINLLSNALKYTRQRNPAVVEIGCVRQDGRIVYFVRDNGAGFDMRYAGKLFGVFQRLHRADEFAGTGVGLAITQRVVHRHGGRIWAEAEVDRGATFYFTLEGSFE